MKIKDLIEAFRLDWEAWSSANKSTWNTDYRSIFRRLPRDETLTMDIIKKVLQTTEPNSRQRKRAAVSLHALARFAGLDFPLKRYSGSYNYTSTKPRTLPSDELILQTFHSIDNPRWRWVFGMLAVYGLRPHEVFCLDFDRMKSGDSVVQVLDGKTGPREVFAFPAEWYYEMSCQNVLLPRVNRDTKSFSQLGSKVTMYFRQPKPDARRQPLPFVPYDLRHRWAVRTIEHGLDASLAARQMGHSLSVHTRIYHQWIDRAVHERAYQQTLRNPHRPQIASIPPSPKT